MAYQTPITIKTAIDNIRKRHYLLPSIQREFVWDTDQIETLFDSLMRDYPISTFLFWKVDKNKIKDFQFYEFLNKYHEKDNRHNRKAEPSNEEDIIALLDGQQRMTSMYVALTGTYAKKMPYYRWDSPYAFPEKKLYLNLLKPSDELETEFDFKFLTEAEAEPCEGYYWFECGQILELTDMGKISMFMMKNKLMDTSVYTEQQSEFAINTLNEFFNVIHQKGTISYYLEKGEELDKVLQIFIRINSGGTKLSYSDLLLSIATAQWKEKDAREVIHEFVDSINQIGDGFNFNKDIVLKSCLVLADFDVKFKVDNFTKENMIAIEKNWDKTSAAMRASIELVSKLGFSRDNLAATNTIIPIAYFIYKNNFEDSIVKSSHREGDRKAIKEWLARVLLKGTFGGQPDSIYPKMRELINDNLGKFPLQETIAHYRGGRKSISFSEDDIDSLLDLQYGKAKTYCVLSLLYPGLNSAYKYHQDHIHPQSLFKAKSLSKLGVDAEDIDVFLSEFNKLPNLQLLEATSNIEKSDQEFGEWLDVNFPTLEAKESYLRQNLIATNQSLELTDFLAFIEVRKQYMKEQLVRMLDVKVITVSSEEASA
ncbi:DUF262 domain-containing protein [Vibrio crassostreae]|uniref:DUF262 domain-containing protein n=1 Tax=Vibrio crassostreae TaxID=246167 RepID=UPI001044E8DD|nr:DUF262 domain-containing protein [Vibrio crassostreae]TCW10990.1 uncharacterized protein with ParB-like and HNH nuclease domain [Vibrio crassostreae]TQK40365.1 uncharacterized protein with ParB-like and HNH nuclease domain [Vibrio crassostreae]CAK3261031.1 DUF262 domain-containing protein [Vibrio crassostreae]CAK3350144.1 DUF262 domain-containing protein [Vibrio crassostreae]CAK3465344.1 DUF262 domain-containing protein [Vibrio crassostreae]